jgi:hypothetical protein
MFTIRTDNIDMLLDDAVARRLSIAVEGDGWKVYGQSVEYSATSGELNVALGTQGNVVIPMYAQPNELTITIIGAPTNVHD